MVAPLSLLSLVLTSVRTGVDGLAVPYFSNAELGPGKQLDEIPPSSASSCSKDGRTFSNCPSDVEPCLALCCPPGKTGPEGSCLKDNSIVESLPHLSMSFITNDGIVEYMSAENYHVLNYDPCDIGWMTSMVMKNYSLFKNGSVYAPDFNGGSPLDFGHYCLMRDPESPGFLAKVCRPWISRSYYMISCVIIATIIMLVILTAYTIVPELRNLHGLIFRSYLIAYIGTYVFVLGLMFTTEMRANIFWFNFSELGSRYFCISCVVWLNVMSFDIWRSFRGFRQIRCNSAEQDRKTFIWYAIYAWVGPIVLTAVAIAIIVCLTRYRIDKIDTDLKQWIGVVVITTVYLCNTFLYTSTALNIRRQKKETAHLVDVMHKHCEVDHQWFSLYVKLFVIMGGHVITWPILLGWPTTLTMHSLATLEVLQGILIFVVFICKANVKRSLFKQFGSIRLTSIVLGKLSISCRA